MADTCTRGRASISTRFSANHIRIWGDGLAFEQYVRYWDAQLRTPWGATHLDRVALVEDGCVTSSAKRYDLSARIDGRIRRVLGIGAVFTSPARRGRGGGRRLLEAMLEAAEAEGYEYAMLFSEIDPALLRAARFRPRAAPRDATRVTRRDGAPAMLVRAGDDRDMPAIAEMSAARSATARFCARSQRRVDSVRHWRSGGCCPVSGRPACARWSSWWPRKATRPWPTSISTIEKGRWFIEEAGDRDPSGARLGAMLQVMLARTPHLPPPEILAWLPHGFVPPQVSSMTTSPTAEVMMIRPLQGPHAAAAAARRGPGRVLAAGLLLSRAASALSSQLSRGRWSRSAGFSSYLRRPKAEG